LAPFSVFQIALALLGVVTATRRLRIWLFDAAVDERAFAAALSTAMRAGHIDLARTLAHACLPAFSARFALEGLGEFAAGRNPRSALLELESVLLAEATRGQALVLVLGRVANPIALIGVIHALAVATHGGEGLLGLERGLPERLALQRSLLMLAIGFGTSLFCLAAAALMRTRARALRQALERVGTLCETTTPPGA